MQIDIVLGDFARRDAQVVAGDDIKVGLTAYSPTSPNSIPLEGALKLILFKGAYDAASIDGIGDHPAIFSIPGSTTQNKAGRWHWRIEQTIGTSRATLVMGVLVIVSPGH